MKGEKGGDRFRDEEIRRRGIRIEPFESNLFSLLFLERYPVPSPPSLSLNPHFDMHHISSYAHLSTSLSLHQQEKRRQEGWDLLTLDKTHNHNHLSIIKAVE